MRVFIASSRMVHMNSHTDTNVLTVVSKLADSTFCSMEDEGFTMNDNVSINDTSKASAKGGSATSNNNATLTQYSTTNPPTEQELRLSTEGTVNTTTRRGVDPPELGSETKSNSPELNRTRVVTLADPILADPTAHTLAATTAPTTLAAPKRTEARVDTEEARVNKEEARVEKAATLADLLSGIRSDMKSEEAWKYSVTITAYIANADESACVAKEFIINGESLLHLEAQGWVFHRDKTTYIKFKLAKGGVLVFPINISTLLKLLCESTLSVRLNKGGFDHVW